MYALAFISIFRTCFSIWNLPVKPVPAFKITVRIFLNISKCYL